MTDTQALGNKLIAEFIGWTTTEDDILPSHWINESGEMVGHKFDTRLSFHTSFDWLIPACFKWDNLNGGLISSEAHWVEYKRLCDELDVIAARYEIQPLWEQLVKNIQWYNQAIENKKTEKII